MGTEEIYQALHGELSQVQGAYASAHFALAEAARDHQTRAFVYDAGAAKAIIATITNATVSTATMRLTLRNLLVIRLLSLLDYTRNVAIRIALLRGAFGSHSRSRTERAKESYKRLIG